jgi:hypothetical protein
LDDFKAFHSRGKCRVAPPKYAGVDFILPADKLARYLLQQGALKSILNSIDQVELEAKTI